MVDIYQTVSFADSRSPMRRIRPSIAARLLLMGGLLLLLMTAAVGFLQWQLEAARVELEARQTEIAHQGMVLDGQTNALKNQSSHLDEQLSSILSSRSWSPSKSRRCAVNRR